MSQLPRGDMRWVSPAGREYVSAPENPFRPPPPDVAGLDSGVHGDTAADPGALDDGEPPPWAARPRPEQSEAA